MDGDARHLARELCARAGMIMEDISATAVMSANVDDASLRLLVAQVAVQLDKATALVAAASVMVGPPSSAANPTR